MSYLLIQLQEQDEYLPGNLPIFAWIQIPIGKRDKLGVQLKIIKISVTLYSPLETQIVFGNHQIVPLLFGSAIFLMYLIVMKGLIYDQPVAI